MTTPTKADFFGGFDSGIFSDPHAEPPGAAGDSDAIEQLREESQFVGQPLVMGRSPEDGLPIPMVPDQASPPSARVTEENLICLTCDHYIEMIAATGMVGEHVVRTVHRFCSLLKTWAELCDLSEADVFFCSGHTRRAGKTPKETYSGLCAVGPCSSFVEMTVQGPSDAEPRTMRWCTRLAGAARLFDLTGQITESCTVWSPCRVTGATEGAIERARRVAAEVKRERAESE